MSSEDQKAEIFLNCRIREDEFGRSKGRVRFAGEIVRTGGALRRHGRVYATRHRIRNRVDERGTQSALRRLQKRCRISPQLMARHFLHRAKVRSRREKIGLREGISRKGREGITRNLRSGAWPSRQTPHTKVYLGRVKGVLPQDEGRLLPVPGRGRHR